MTRVKSVRIYKSFGSLSVLDGLDFTIESGEFFTLLGASGCGKTTTLRLILGSISPDFGGIYFDGENITKVLCHKRNVGIVYQDYALFPHLTVHENVAFGLKVMKADRIAWRVAEMMCDLDICDLGKRYPHQISGGEKQRVALARALVMRPRVLLLDEPLSNIDASLRHKLKAQLRQMQRDLKMTTLYVTHNIEEALTISDKIAIMREGRIIEVGTPQEIFLHPKKEYTENFMRVITERMEELDEFQKGGKE